MASSSAVFGLFGVGFVALSVISIMALVKAYETPAAAAPTASPTVPPPPPPPSPTSARQALSTVFVPSSSASTIQGAVNLLEQRIVDGDIVSGAVMVAPGIYEENLTFTQARVGIQGEGGRDGVLLSGLHTIVSGARVSFNRVAFVSPTDIPSNAAVFLVNGGSLDVSESNVFVSGDTRYGCLINPGSMASFVTFRDVSVSGAVAGAWTWLRSTTTATTSVQLEMTNVRVTVSSATDDGSLLRLAPSTTAKLDSVRCALTRDAGALVTLDDRAAQDSAPRLEVWGSQLSNASLVGSARALILGENTYARLWTSSLLSAVTNVATLTATSRLDVGGVFGYTGVKSVELNGGNLTELTGLTGV